jgi:hypothetical protein
VLTDGKYFRLTAKISDLGYACLFFIFASRSSFVPSSLHYGAAFSLRAARAEDKPLDLPQGKKTRRSSPLQIAIEKGFLTLTSEYMREKPSRSFRMTII